MYPCCHTLHSVLRRLFVHFSYWSQVSQNRYSSPTSILNYIIGYLKTELISTSLLVHFAQKIYTEVVICLQVDYWQVLLERTHVREWGKQNWPEREGEQWWSCNKGSANPARRPRACMILPIPKSVLGGRTFLPWSWTVTGFSRHPGKRCNLGESSSFWTRQFLRDSAFSCQQPTAQRQLEDRVF